MPNDKDQIRELLAAWMRATAAGQLQPLLELMDEDVVFLIPGQPPMRGRESIAVAFNAAMQRCRIDGKSEIQEIQRIQIAGEMAYCWNRLSVTVTPLPSGSPVERSGYTLSVLRKKADGRWVLFRDANLLTADSGKPA
jgi:uncharacterized protein (TIGR02246 family)